MWNAAWKGLPCSFQHGIMGIGMGPSMIGVNKYSLAFDNEGKYMVLFNPEILRKSEPGGAEEGCLSLQHLKNKRRRSIKAQIRTRSLKPA